MRVEAGSVVRLGARGRGPGRRRVAAVIGGAGFIGSHLCEALLTKGRDVVCLDNFHRGSLHNLAGLTGEPRGVVVSHDVLRRIPDDLPRFDEIYHLIPSDAAEGAAARRSARIALTVFDRAARDGARVLLVCGAAEKIAAGGEGEPVGPRGFIERLFVRCAAKGRVDLAVARLWDTYGPRMPMDGGCEVAAFALRALRGEPIHVPDGGQVRRLCFVADAVQACIRVMEEGGAPRAAVQSTELTLGLLARTVLELSGSVSEMAVPASCGPRSIAPSRPRCDAEAAGSAEAARLRETIGLTLADLAARIGLAGQAPARQRFG